MGNIIKIADENISSFAPNTTSIKKNSHIIMKAVNNNPNNLLKSISDIFFQFHNLKIFKLLFREPNQDIFRNIILVPQIY